VWKPKGTSFLYWKKRGLFSNVHLVPDSLGYHFSFKFAVKESKKFGWSTLSFITLTAIPYSVKKINHLTVKVLRKNEVLGTFQYKDSIHHWTWIGLIPFSFSVNSVVGETEANLVYHFLRDLEASGLIQ